VRDRGAGKTDSDVRPASQLTKAIKSVADTQYEASRPAVHSGYTTVTRGPLAARRSRYLHFSQPQYEMRWNLICGGTGIFGFLANSAQESRAIWTCSRCHRCVALASPFSLSVCAVGPFLARTGWSPLSGPQGLLRDLPMVSGALTTPVRDDGVPCRVLRSPRAKREAWLPEHTVEERPRTAVKQGRRHHVLASTVKIDSGSLLCFLCIQQRRRR